jgi:hypothetical protein
MSKAPARHEQFQVLDLLIGAGELAGAAAREPSSPAAVSSRTTSVCSGHGHFFGK